MTEETKGQACPHRRFDHIAPRSLPLPDVAREAGAADTPALRGELFDLWLATGAVDLHAHEPSIGDATRSHPLACPVARWHATHGGPVTNRWHQEVRLDGAPLRAVLAVLDGTRTMPAVAHAVGCTLEVARASVEAIAAAALLDA